MLSQIPFQTQYYYPPQRQPLSSSHGQYGAFDMGPMAHALPQQSPQMNSMQRPHFDYESPNVLSPASVYHMHHVAQYPQPRGLQQHQQRAASSTFHSMQSSMNGRQPQGPYPRMDMYGYNMGAPQYSPVDSRFSPQSYGFAGGMMNGTPSMYPHQSPEPAAVPSYPRGPPRKPKQSGNALWVGNLPAAANVRDLKDHFSREATKEIESVFLISKSNCAFVNYRSEAACLAAMNRFHDSTFHGVRLVCRLRRGSTTTNSPAAADGPMSRVIPLPGGTANTPAQDHHHASDPVIVGQPKVQEHTETSGLEKVAEKYFIVKSLTVQDLEASIRNGIWATQSHNEDTLNKAYDEAENVYLIFSANKSGEYFGYARMASRIAGEPVSLGISADGDEAQGAGTPQSIFTPATATAPQGHIIDDSARGTIFWEAETSEADDVESPSKDSSGDVGGNGQGWGRQFKIEWICTARLPFFRTRGLRNPWNMNREVKIARDGTELEPGIGQKLVGMFNPMGAAGLQGVVYR